MQKINGRDYYKNTAIPNLTAKRSRVGLEFQLKLLPRPTEQVHVGV